MSKAKRQHEKDPNYENQTEAQRYFTFWKDDQEYLRDRLNKRILTTRFWLYKGVVFTNRKDVRTLICPAKETDRYEHSKDIIDAAIHDLANKEDGTWYFDAINKWYRKPLPEFLLERLKSEI